MKLEAVVASVLSDLESLRVPPGVSEMEVTRVVRAIDRLDEQLGPEDLVLIENGGPEAASALDAAAKHGVKAFLVPSGPESETLEADASARGVLWARYRDSAGPALSERLSDLFDVPSQEPAVGGVRSDDLGAFAEAVATSVGGPVILEDPSFNVIAYSSFIGQMDSGRAAAILSRRIPDYWFKHLEATGSLSRLLHTNEIIDLAGGPFDAHRRLLVGVRAHARLVGVIWVAEGERALPDDAHDRLRRAAELAIPYFLTYEDAHTSDRERRGATLLSVLEGKSPRSRLAEVGLDPDRELAILCFAPRRSAGSAGSDLTSLAAHISLTCTAYRWRAALATIGELVVVAADVTEATESSIRRLLRDVTERSHRVIADGAIAGVSRRSRTSGALRGHRDEAEEVVAFLRRHGASQAFGSFADLEPELALDRLLVAVGDDARWQLAALERLRRLDIEQGSELVATLEAVLTHESVAAASRALGVHPTTTRYRLHQITTRTGLDLENHRVRVACWLSLAAGWTDPARSGAADRAD